MSGLRRLYRQYKRDTGKICTWLGRTALLHGYELSNLTGGEAGDQGPRTIKLTARQYIEAAELVKNKGVKVSLVHLDTLERCIRNRLTYTQAFGSIIPQVEPDDRGTRERDDETQAFFVQTLQRVLEILRSARAKSIRSQLRQSVAATTPQDFRSTLATAFDALDLEEGDAEHKDDDSKGDLPVAKPLRPGKRAKHKHVLQLYFSPTDSHHESCLDLLGQLAVAFEELNKVRAYLKTVWAEYKQCKIDLVSAAFVTNTAMELLRGSWQTDLADQIKQKLGMRIDQAIFHLADLMHTGETKEKLPPTGDSLLAVQDPRVRQTFEFYALCNPPARQEPSNPASPTKQLVQRMLPSHQQDPWTWRCKAGHLLMAFADELTCLSKTYYGGSVWSADQGVLPLLGSGALQKKTTLYNFGHFDDFTHQLEDFRVNRKPDLHMWFCAAILTDVNQALGASAKRCYDEMLHLLSRMQWVGQLTVETRRDSTSGAAREALRRLSSACDCWTSARPDLLTAFVHDVCSTDGTRTPRSVLLRYNPICCGMLLLQFELDYGFHGFRELNGGSWTALHVYHAYRNHGILAGRLTEEQARWFPRWPYMEAFVGLCGAERLFGGKVPTTLEDAVQSFNIISGASAAQLQSTRQSMDGPSGGQRLIPAKWTARFSKSPKSPPTPKSQTKSPKKSARSARSSISSVIRYSRIIDEVRAIPHGAKLLPYLEDRYTARGSSGASGDCSFLVKTVDPKRPPLKEGAMPTGLVDLLPKILAAMVADRPHLTFDYMLLHLQASQCLDQVRAAIMQDGGALVRQREEADETVFLTAGLLLNDEMAKRHKRPPALVFPSVPRRLAETINSFLGPLDRPDAKQPVVMPTVDTAPPSSENPLISNGQRAPSNALQFHLGPGGNAAEQADARGAQHRRTPRSDRSSRRR